MRYKDETNRGQSRGSPLCGGGILSPLIGGFPRGVHRPRAMKPVSVQVITYAPTAFYHCQHCELAFREVGLGERVRREAAANALPDDLARDFQALSDWIHGLLDTFGSRIRVRVVDAASIEGFVKSILHRSRRFPMFIVDGNQRITGFDREALDAALARRFSSLDEPSTGGGAPV